MIATPKNNDYVGAAPGTDHIKEPIIRNHMSKQKREKNHLIDLFIILKPEIKDSKNMLSQPELHKVHDGHVIGFITLTLNESSFRRSADIGIVIHHEARKTTFVRRQ